MIAKRIACYLLLTTFLCAGCPERKDASFVLLVQDHCKVSTETCDALIASIKTELSKPNISDTEKTAFVELIERLDYIKRSGITIDKYINSQVDQELRAEVLRLIAERGLNKTGE
jgi:hypothetical protein